MWKRKVFKRLYSLRCRELVICFSVDDHYTPGCSITCLCLLIIDFRFPCPRGSGGGQAEHAGSPEWSRCRQYQFRALGAGYLLQVYRWDRCLGYIYFRDLPIVHGIGCSKLLYYDFFSLVWLPWVLLKYF